MENLERGGPYLPQLEVETWGVPNAGDSSGSRGTRNPVSREREAVQDRPASEDGSRQQRQAG